MPRVLCFVFYSRDIRRNSFHHALANLDHLVGGGEGEEDEEDEEGDNSDANKDDAIDNEAVDKNDQINQDSKRKSLALDLENNGNGEKQKPEVVAETRIMSPTRSAPDLLSPAEDNDQTIIKTGKYN